MELDNLLQRRITEITSNFAKNFVIHDITDGTTVVVNGLPRRFSMLFEMIGVVVDSRWARTINHDEMVNAYLNANNLTWYYSFDTESHITLIYIVEKGQEISQ